MSITKDRILESIQVKQALLQSDELCTMIDTISATIIDAYRRGNRVFFCGNGGSAADAQHLAAELSGRFYYDRPALAAEALHVNTSYLTAVANDYSYDLIYARYLRGAANKGDIIIGISTSGNSKNVVEAFKAAEELDVISIALTGEGGGLMADLAKFSVKVPSKDTPRIQEAHILIGHIICEQVEAALFPKK